MQIRFVCVFLLSTVASLSSRADSNVFSERRGRAAAAFADGTVLFHASSMIEITADGFRQDPYFYYFTGLQNTVGALLAIDGKSRESWLFLPTRTPFADSGLLPEVRPGPEAAKQLGIDHVVDWTELSTFLAARSGSAGPLYYANDFTKFAELPANLLSARTPEAPTWLQIILQKWPAFQAQEAGERIGALLAVQNQDEIAALRSAANSTVMAMMAAMRAVRPGVSQRAIESVVESSCWKSGAHGVAFWPWAMSGENAVFPKPFTSLAAYDHLDGVLRTGDLIRLDIGCEWKHYGGDLGRTLPVSGHFTEEQRETWNIFVMAYRTAARMFRDGVTVDKIFEAWRSELLRQRASAKTPLAQRAIDLWSERKNVPFWQVHTSNLLAGFPVGPLRTGTTINFEPIASIDGFGYFLEDMYVITPNGAELLTPGVPYSADEIEAAMR